MTLYCTIDLHSNNSVVSVIDETDRVIVERRLSNGKKKGENNTKNGNRHLAWAFVEAANFAVRYNTQVQRFYERKKASATAQSRSRPWPTSSPAPLIT